MSRSSSTRPRPDSTSRLTAREAAAMLGVSASTLYAYVSRGLLRSESVAGRSRERRYPVDDIERLTERKAARKDPARAAAKGLSWGSPVLDSALTLIEDGRLFYRGVDAAALARRASVEEVAALLWTGDARDAHALFSGRAARVPGKSQALWRENPRIGPVERCQLVLPAAAAADQSGYDLRAEAVAKTGAQLLTLLCAAVCDAPVVGPIDTALTAAWSKKRTVTPAIRAALILCADHELNVSAFTARCIASARATPYEVILGALAALRGRRHGGASEAVDALVQAIEQPRPAREVLANHLRLEGAIPGFGHPAYPKGDPRARVLIAIARKYGVRSACDVTDGVVRAARGLTGQLPNLDFGLVALARALGLPRDAPIALFALGRTIGWIAHAIEQYADDRLIRPRAKYVGPMPAVTVAPVSADRRL